MSPKITFHGVVHQCSASGTVECYFRIAGDRKYSTQEAADIAKVKLNDKIAMTCLDSEWIAEAGEKTGMTITQLGVIPRCQGPRFLTEHQYDPEGCEARWFAAWKCDALWELGPEKTLGRAFISLPSIFIPWVACTSQSGEITGLTFHSDMMPTMERIKDDLPGHFGETPRLSTILFLTAGRFCWYELMVEHQRTQLHLYNLRGVELAVIHSVTHDTSVHIHFFRNGLSPRSWTEVERMIRESTGQAVVDSALRGFVRMA